MDVTSLFVNETHDCDSVSGNVSVMQISNQENKPIEYTFRNDKSISRELLEEFSHSLNYRTPLVENDASRSPMSSTFNSELSNRSKLTHDASVQTNFTLSSRESYEPNDLLKSCCVEVFSEKSIILPSSYNMWSGCNRTPPSRCINPSRLLFKKETPVKGTAGKRLSLRSKTMICSALGKTKPRSKMFKRHKSMEESNFISNTYSLMPHQEITSSNSENVLVNPFEVDLTERLGKSIFSPDVFANVLSPSEDSEFLRWTIEDISSINPVPIEEDVKLPSEDENPERESLVQQEIDRYFSETHLVLSPNDLPKTEEITSKHNIVINAAASTPKICDLKVVGDVVTNFAQTDLTLPGDLSDDLAESLQNYFQIYESEDISFNASTLRRKLFFHSEDDPPSPVRFEKASSPMTNLSLKMESSPLAVHGRYFTPLTNHQLSSPEVSPVVQSPVVKSKKESLTCKKTLHLYFAANDSAPSEIREPVIAVDLESSSLPSSQDTGYNTEDSSRQCVSPAASTPTRAQHRPRQ